MAKNKKKPAKKTSVKAKAKAKLDKKNLNTGGKEALDNANDTKKTLEDETTKEGATDGNNKRHKNSTHRWYTNEKGDTVKVKNNNSNSDVDKTKLQKTQYDANEKLE